jgi:hypothetical protein
MAKGTLSIIVIRLIGLSGQFYLVSRKLAKTPSERFGQIKQRIVHVQSCEVSVGIFYFSKCFPRNGPPGNPPNRYCVSCTCRESDKRSSNMERFKDSPNHLGRDIDMNSDKSYYSLIYTNLSTYNPPDLRISVQLPVPSITRPISPTDHFFSSACPSSRSDI